MVEKEVPVVVRSCSDCRQQDDYVAIDYTGYLTDAMQLLQLDNLHERQYRPGCAWPSGLARNRLGEPESQDKKKVSYLSNSS